MKIEQKHSLPLGILFIVLAMFCFALMGVFAKFSTGTVSLEVFARSFVNLLLFIPFLYKGSPLFAKIPSLLQLIFRNIFGLLALGSAFYAIQYIPLANAILLNNTAPLFLPLVILVVTRIKTPFMVLVGVCVGFVGVVLTLHPSLQSFNLPSLIGLASGLFGAISFFLVRDISKKMSPWQLIFYYALTGTIITAIIIPFQWHELNWSGVLFLSLGGIGVFGAFYQIFLTLALSYAQARIITPLIFLGILFASLFDWLIWDIVPDYLTLSGFAVMIAGGVMTILFGKKHIIGRKK